MTDAIRTCVENAEQQVRMFSQRIQWTPLLLVVSMFACENTHRVALGLARFNKKPFYQRFLTRMATINFRELFLLQQCVESSRKLKHAIGRKCSIINTRGRHIRSYRSKH